MSRAGVCAALLVTAELVGAVGSPAQATGLAAFAVDGDAITSPLEGRAGDAERGRAIVLDRATGNCLICHQVPVASELFQGELGGDLAGVGARLSTGQIRLRLVDQSRLNPATLMPPYFRADGLTRVAPRFAGQPVLTAQQIEDVIAWLATLKQ
jgi:L-cysteine S-thiosulfotransferase